MITRLPLSWPNNGGMADGIVSMYDYAAGPSTGTPMSEMADRCLLMRILASWMAVLFRLTSQLLELDAMLVARAYIEHELQIASDSKILPAGPAEGYTHCHTLEHSGLHV